MSQVRAPFTYYGGKQGMAARLVELMPSHRVYIEPFFGSGAVFFAKHPSAHEILNDVDDRIVTFFRVLRDRPEDLIRVCSLTPYSRTEFARALESTDDELERARRFWVRVNQSFAKTARENTGWSITTARTQSTPGSVSGRLSRFAECAERLSGATIENRDAIELLERFGTTEDTVVYADPPYLGSTRSSAAASLGYSGGDYSHDMPSVIDHERLAACLHSLKATVILSGYPSELYEDLYGDWHQVDVHVAAHSSNAARADRGRRIERIWLNREPHDLFAGQWEKP